MRQTGRARREAEEARADADAARVEAEEKAESLERRAADVAQLREEFGAWVARLGEMKPGDELHVPSLNKTGRLHRLELHKNRAIVDVDRLQMEVPLTELMPDLGQAGVRKELQDLRRSAVDTARAADADRQKLAEAKAEADRLVKAQQDKAKQFDRWVSRLTRVKVGDVVSIAVKPGHGKVVEVDLKALRVVVELKGGERKTISLQELFPQTGPYAETGKPAERKTGRARGVGRDRKPKPDANRPMDRGLDHGKKARKNHAALLKTKPGEKIYVIPFHAAATLVRIDEKKDIATVSRGAFEMQVPLSDCEPVGYQQ